jgi:hypothetical protein
MTAAYRIPHGSPALVAITIDGKPWQSFSGLDLHDRAAAAIRNAGWHRDLAAALITLVDLVDKLQHRGVAWGPEVLTLRPCGGSPVFTIGWRPRQLTVLTNQAPPCHPESR